MYRRQPSDSLTVKDKITLLKAEIGDRVLTGNQLKIYRAFTKMTGRPTTIETIDGNGDMIRFKIYSNKNDDGTIHILQKHYKTNIGYVSAREIVNLCSVIEHCKKTRSRNSTVYTLVKSNNRTRLKTALKIVVGKDYILKSFYSDR